MRGLEKQQRRRLPQTDRGISTREVLLESAKAVLYDQGFQSASVASFCREAEVANSSFYQYFDDKFAVYSEIVRTLSDQIVASLEQASRQSDDPVQRIRAMNSAFFDLCSEEHRLYQIFREAEFIDKEIAKTFYDPIVGIYGHTLAEGAARSLFGIKDSDVAAWLILGLQEFAMMRWLIWGRGQVQSGGIASGTEPSSTAERFILHGLGFSESEYFEHTFERQQSTELPAGDASTRTALLAAAENHFGKLGFHKASISDITREAGVAQGTFYIYFPSKQAIFAQLVRQINERLIAEIRSATSTCRDRKSIEVSGFQAFFHFIKKHPLAYRIVREAEFVDQETGQGYYRRIAAGYIKGLQFSMQKREIDVYPPETLAYCLMGIGHFAGMKWLIWEENQNIPEIVFEEIMRFISRGILIA